MEDCFENTPQPSNTELISLIQAIADCDEMALSRLYDLTINRVYRLAYTMVKSEVDAEEIASDVYLQVWQRSTQYDPTRGPVIAWLMVNCRSLALDLLRRRRSQQKGREKLLSQTWETEELSTADELLNLLQEGTAVHQALTGLPAIQQQMIALAFFKDMSHQEIATALQLPLGTVKSHIRRGLQSLRTCIDL